MCYITNHLNNPVPLFLWRTNEKNKSRYTATGT